MTEQGVRQRITEIDEKRARARLLECMGEWPMFSPSSVRADKRRGILRWFGSLSSDALREVALTRDERSELRDWLLAKSTQLAAEADAIAAALDGPTLSPDGNTEGNDR